MKTAKPPAKNGELSAKAKSIAESGAAALRESEERFQLVANTAPVMIWVADTTKLCTYFNPRWLEFTGRRLDQELGNGWAEGVHSDDLERCLEMYSIAFDKREPFRMQYRIRRHDGEYRWILDNGVPRFNKDGSFAGYIGSGIDVTEQKLAEETLSTLSQKLIEVQEAERRRIAQELHDDINQRVVLLAAKLHEFREKLPASAVELKRDIGDIGEGIKELGNDIQALSHELHSSKLEYLGLETAARSFCREVASLQKVRVEFQAEHIPRELPREVSLSLFRVLQEALHNGVKHSQSKTFEVTLKTGAADIELIVRDFGVGFEPEAVVKGLGLGLTGMRERLKLVDGQLSINARPKHGTMIRAVVPIKRRGRARAKVAHG